MLTLPTVFVIDEKSVKWKIKVEVETPKGKKLAKWTLEKLESVKLGRGGEMKLFIDLEKAK